MIYLILFEIFNFLDLYFTWSSVILNGVGELNPIVNWLIVNYGIGGLISIKLMSAAFGLFLYFKSMLNLKILTYLYFVLSLYHIIMVSG